MYFAFLLSIVWADPDLTVGGDAAITFSSSEHKCKIGILKEYDKFGVYCDSAQMFIDEKSEILGDLLTESALIMKNALYTNNVRQWNIMHQENLEYVEGWTNNTVTDCNGMRVLGGHCKYSAGESEKEYTNLPDHDTIRITGQMLFLDTWNKESAYIRVDGQIVWINMHPQPGDNICGLEEVHDSVLSFDVNVST